jgi:hypothetical protein
MAGADKRAKLLSDLLAAKGEASGNVSRTAEPESAPVIQIADRRVGEDRPSEAPAAPSVLYSKGTATASTFRPSYWSFDRDQQGEASAAPARAKPPVPATPVTPVAQGPARKSLLVNIAIGFGCLALAVSTTLFVLSTGRHAEVPPVRPEPVAIAAASAPAVPLIPLPPQPPAPSVPAPAAPPVAASAPAPAASDAPPSPVSAAPTAESIAGPTPTPTVSAVPAPNSNPEADALLARGDDLLVTGDVAAARLFYERAAEQGSAAAATAVGQTYDPAVLELLRVRGVRGNAQMAAQWYRKAIAAGDRQAEIRLKRLLARTPG